MSYLDEWEKSVHDRDNYDSEEKERMLIARETRMGLRLTGTSTSTS